MIQLREYQKEISINGLEILKKFKILYLAMEVRTGKTLTSLHISDLYGAKNVLFATKKKAIPSILNDYKLLNPNYQITVINDESLHKVDDTFDLVIHDEHHRFGAYPKPNKSAKLFKQNYGNLPMIFLSGTPFPESYSQVFHQFWISKQSPFIESNFYKWAKNYVNITQRNLGYGMVNDYSDANFKKIKPIIEPYIITFTQAKAGFETNVKETVLYCDINTTNLIKQLTKDLVIEGKEEVILADTAVKLQSKIHQLSSGTIKFESGNSKVLDYSKAYFIAEKFKDKKIAIFYKFKEELEAIRAVFKYKLTTDLTEFNTSDKNIALQFISGREGISLKMADCLVAYNIDFSATTYFQFKDRLTTKERKENNLYWIFSKGGIEEKIYKAVQNKKSYTLNLFKKDFMKPIKKNLTFYEYAVTNDIVKISDYTYKNMSTYKIYSYKELNKEYELFKKDHGI